MQLEIDNFAKGWATDAELDQDKLYSFLTFINSDVDYERGASVRRPGYNRHHVTSLTGTPKQFYSFTNLAGETRELVIAYDPAATAHYHLFVLSGGAGYEVRNYSTSPTTILVFDSRDNYPFITVGNRVFFADDNGWFWSDYSSLVKGAGPYTYECYQVGIDKPTFTTGIEALLLTFHGFSAGYTELNEALAQSFALNQLEQVGPGSYSYDQYVDAITIYMLYTGNAYGNIRVRIETDNAGQPSGTGVSEWSNWVDVSIIDSYTLNNGYVIFTFEESFWLDASTTYWLVLDGDASYDDMFSTGVHSVSWGHALAYTGQAMIKSGGVWANDGANDYAILIGSEPTLGTPDENVPGDDLAGITTINYRYTFYNDVYGIESEPADYRFTKLFYATIECVRIFDIPSSFDDAQITHVRIYRGYNNNYYHVVDIPISDTYGIDAIDSARLGGELQTGGDLITAKHLRLKDANGNLIVPYLLEIWNGRIWAVKFHDNVLNYSKMLEEAGATGVAGDSIYDYFPADNKWTLDSEIRSIRKRGEDEFEAYTSNNNVHVFRGGSDALNPPPDLTRQEMLIGANCFDDRTLQEYKGRHIFLTSDKEIKAFNGTVDLEELGDAITSFLLQNGTKVSSCIYKSQYCLGCDADSDNVMDSIIIFDLSQPRITNWRRYQYLNSYGATGDLMKFYNLFVTRDARMFACPADLDTNAFYVVQLMTGYSDDWTTEYDDGVDITRIIQTQFIIPARRARWTRVELSCFYPHGMYYGTDFYGGGMYGGTETIPTYVIYAIGKSDEFCQTTIAPKSSRDITGHVAGIRLLSEECSIRIEDTGDKPDEVRSLELHWSFN